nr:hypothetical protein [Sicyoidochytrium minutum DNA virus]
MQTNRNNRILVRAEEAFTGLITDPSSFE